MTHQNDTYKVWAADNMMYGPIDFATLREWVSEDRILSDTWIHSERTNAWYHAREIDALRPHLHSRLPVTAPISGGVIHPEELRQFSVFAGISNELLEQLIGFGELCEPPPDQVILKKGEPGDAIFFVLSGSVRVRLMIGREDKTLNKIPAGQFLGEMAMFTQAPRSADVVAMGATRLMRLSNQAFLELIKEVPSLAATFLFTMASIMAHRISETNSNFQKQVAGDFVWR